MDGRNATRLEALFQMEIEIRRIDADKCLRRIAEHGRQQFAANAGDFAVMLEHFGVTPHCEFFGGEQGLKAGSLHFGAADAVKACIGKPFLQGLDQQAGKQITGSLPGDHRNSDCL